MALNWAHIFIFRLTTHKNKFKWWCNEEEELQTIQTALVGYQSNWFWCKVRCFFRVRSLKRCRLNLTVNVPGAILKMRNIHWKYFVCSNDQPAHILTKSIPGSRVAHIRSTSLMHDICAPTCEEVLCVELLMSNMIMCDLILFDCVYLYFRKVYCIKGYQGPISEA